MMALQEEVFLVCDLCGARVPFVSDQYHALHGWVRDGASDWCPDCAGAQAPATTPARPAWTGAAPPPGLVPRAWRGRPRVRAR